MYSLYSPYHTGAFSSVFFFMSHTSVYYAQTPTRMIGVVKSVRSYELQRPPPLPQKLLIISTFLSFHPHVAASTPPRHLHAHRIVIGCADGSMEGVETKAPIPVSMNPPVVLRGT